MARVRKGVPTVRELKEGELEHRYVKGTGLVAYTRHENQLYSSKMYPTSVPPIIDSKARNIINKSDTINVNISEGELELDFGSLIPASIADGDHILFIDTSSANEVRREALADLLDLVAGTVGTTGLDRSGATLVVSDLHPVGVNGSANQLLTDDGDGTVTSESTLSYSSETLTIGADDDGDSTITRKTHSDEAGGKLLIKGGNGTGENKAGGDLEFFAGVGTGSASGGDMLFKVAPAGSGSSSLNTVYTALTIDQSRQSTFAGDVVLEGGAGALQFTYAGNNTIKIVDNQANALVIENSVGGSDFMIFTTTNSGEKITSNKDFYVSEIHDIAEIYAETEADMNFYLRYDDAGSSGDVAFQFYDYNTGFLDITYTSNLAIIKTSGSGVNLEINSRGGDITFKDDSTSSMIFDMNTTAGATYIQNGAGNAVVAIDDGDQRLYFYDKGGEYIVGDGTDITIASGADIILSPTTYVGIGDTTPESLLHMKGANPVLTIQDTETSAGSADARIRLAESDGSGNVENYWDIHNSGLNLLLTRSDGTGNVVIRSCFIDDYAVNIKPADSTNHMTMGLADKQNNYSLLGIYSAAAASISGVTADTSFDNW